MTPAPRVTVTSRTRRVSVDAAGEGGIVQVEGGQARALPDGSFEVRGDRTGSGTIVVRCPPGSHVSVGTLTGPVETHGPLGEVRIVTETGKIRVERAERVDARTRSGSVDVRWCAGECRLVTASSHVEVGSAGSVSIASQSGSVAAGSIGGGQVRTVSGSIHIGLATDPSPASGLRVMSTSGGVEITVPQGSAHVARLTSSSGRIRSAVPSSAVPSSGEPGESPAAAAIEVRTTSGSIRVERR